MELGSDRQVNRLPLRNTGGEKEDFQTLKIVRLGIEPRAHPLVQFLGLLLGIGFGFSEIENIAGLVILNRQQAVHGTRSQMARCCLVASHKLSFEWAVFPKAADTKHAES